LKIFEDARSVRLYFLNLKLQLTFKKITVIINYDYSLSV